MLPWSDLWTPQHLVHRVAFLLHEQQLLTLQLQPEHRVFKYLVLTYDHLFVVKSHAPVNFGRVQSSWAGVGDPLYLFRVWAGLPGQCPALSNLFWSIPLANFRRNANWDSTGSLLARAREFNVLTSETDPRKVNCRWGHHLVCQTSYILIGS